MVDCKQACLICTVLIFGCVDQGQPLVVERSPIFEKPNPSTVPAKKPISSGSQQGLRQTRVEAAHTGIKLPKQYTVRKGDSLFSIAWRFELDHKKIARRNNIRSPYVIHPGQLLTLRTVEGRQSLPAKPRAPKQAVSKPGRAASVPRLAKKPTVRSKPASSTPRQGTPSQGTPSQGWRWPIAGKKPSKEFGAANKGVDFALSNNAVVVASNHGEVVYAGNGIGGYAKLIIIRHPQDLLSAYSYNGTHGVKEQQQVKAGQKLADIKVIGRGPQNLHFELRNNGKPINPRSIIR